MNAIRKQTFLNFTTNLTDENSEVEVIDLNACSLQEIPEEVYQHKESVRKLLLETNSLKTLPKVCVDLNYNLCKFD